MSNPLLPLSSLVFIVVYGTSFFLDLPIIYYLPISSEIHVGLSKPPINEPIMTWYGYFTMALLATGLTLIPGTGISAEPLRVSPWAYLVLPLLFLILVVTKESHWFIG